MKFNPKVSIIIPVYNGSNYLKEAIDSALAQTYKNTEIIVVNDGSNDKGATEKIAKSYGKKIRYFNKENGGVATALNFGIEKMTGEYFSWLSHDDIYYPEKVEKQVEVLSKLENKETIIYSNVEYINEFSETINITRYEDLYSSRQLSSGVLPVLKGLTNGCTMMIPKQLFKESGNFNEKLITCNDYEMWFRLFSQYPIKFSPLVLTKYRIHDLQGTKTMDSRNIHRQSDQIWSLAIKRIKNNQMNELEVAPIDFFIGLAQQMKIDLRNIASNEALIKAKYFYDKEKRKVSVVMPCYNAAKYLQESIESMLNQTLANFELIIVDDSSTDKSWEIIKKYAEKDFRIKAIKNVYSKGVAGAMNTGLEVAEGKYLTRMDADDISDVRRLEVQTLFLEENPQYDFCCVNMSSFGNLENPCLYKKQTVPLEWQFFWGNPMASASTMYRNDLIKKFDIKFRSYKVASDYDFLCQVLCYGRPFMLYDQVLYRYRIHKKSIFQQNKFEALNNSISINRYLIKSLFNVKYPQFHYLLTDFVQDPTEKGNIKIKETVEWVYLLMKMSQEKWNWSKKDYKEADIYINERIKSCVISHVQDDFIKANKKNEQEVSKLMKQLNENNDMMKQLNENNDMMKNELQNLYSSKRWKFVTKFADIKSKIFS